MNTQLQQSQTVDISKIKITNSRSLRMLFKDSKIRPPVLSEMMPDINKMALGMAKKRHDPTCYALSVDDLLAECYYKIAVVLTKDKLERIPNRAEAFKYIKAVFNNHTSSLVARHRMTLKRGKKKMADGEDREISLNVCTKNSDLSADDPDQHIQIVDSKSDWKPDSSFVEDISVYLTPVERLVILDFAEANGRTRFYAEYESLVSNPTDEKEGTVINFSERNRAEGLGMDLAQYKKALASLRQKLKTIMSQDNTEKEVAWNKAIAHLEQVFDVKIPASIDKMVVRRLFTLCSVKHFDLVENHQDVIASLNTIGAKIPEKKSGTVSCFGIFHNSSFRTCAVCGVRKSCYSECINYGLGNFRIDPEILGSKNFRVPVIVNVENDSNPIIQTSNDESIYNCLLEVFNASRCTDKILFRHKETGAIACSIPARESFKVEIIGPSEELAAKLIKIEDGEEVHYWVDNAMGSEEVVAVIEQHSNEMFNSSIK